MGSYKSMRVSNIVTHQPTANQRTTSFSTFNNCQTTFSTARTMAQLPPGDIRTVPSQKLFFNAPFDNKISLYMKVVNAGGHRIGFAFKTTNAARLQMDPPSGVLDPKEEINILISCDSFDAEAQGTNSDRVTIEWVNTPEGAAKTFRREWLQGDVMTRRKNLPIEYNL